MDLVSQLKQTLQKQFQLESFRPGQKEAIETLLTGRDELVVMPTGAGKSLIYQLASFHRPGLTLVILPLIALMQEASNVHGAFGLTGKGKGRSYIIVDDLYDSGATMREVYRLFKHNNADKIYVLAITRTIHTDA